MNQIYEILLPLAGFVGLIAIAAGIRFGVPAACSALYWRLLHMPKDLRSAQWRPRHVASRGRPALVAQRSGGAGRVGAEHRGATLDWSPDAEMANAPQGEPEETAAEAAQREADELARHRAELERAAEESVTAEWAPILDPKLAPLQARVDLAARAALRGLGIGLTDDDIEQLLAKHQAAALPTGEYPTVRPARELVSA